MLAMRLLTCFLQLLAGLALPAVPSQHSAVPARDNSSETEVVPFQEVWGRSYCRSMEKLVNIVSLYPNEVQYMFNPSCVALLRCTGCCGDESLHCVPVETANITMQIVKIGSKKQPTYVEMTFSQHKRCECRMTSRDDLSSHFWANSHSCGDGARTCLPVWDVIKPERRRNKGSGKRKKEKQRPTVCHLCGNTTPLR